MDCLTWRRIEAHPIVELYWAEEVFALFLTSTTLSAKIGTLPYSGALLTLAN